MSWRSAAMRTWVTPRAVLGLPEVTLGLIPGAGGTLRLSRLVGVVEAIRLITSGRRERGADAVSLGMADAVAEDDLITAAARHVAGLVGGKRVLRALPAIGAEPSDIEAAEKEACRRAAGSDAVDAAIAAVRRGAAAGAEDALAEVRATSLRLRIGEQSKALRHLFFAERAALAATTHVSPTAMRISLPTLRRRCARAQSDWPRREGSHRPRS